MKKTLTLSAWKKEVFRDQGVKEQYNLLKPEMDIVRAMIEARLKRGITQQILAEKMKTKQSVISRLESGRANPSISVLQKLARALHMELEIKFVAV